MGKGLSEEIGIQQLRVVERFSRTKGRKCPIVALLRLKSQKDFRATSDQGEESTNV